MALSRMTRNPEIRMRGLAILWLLVLASPAGAQDTTVTPWRREVLNSSALNEQRVISVATPEGYRSGNARYPVLVILDADDRAAEPSQRDRLRRAGQHLSLVGEAVVQPGDRRRVGRAGRAGQAGRTNRSRAIREPLRGWTTRAPAPPASPRAAAASARCSRRRCTRADPERAPR